MKAGPEPCLKALAPYREDLVVGVECLFTWYWLADLCAREGIPFVLGHALSMKAIHGGKATNDTIDSHKMAVLLRGGMLPQAYVSPAARRATPDLLRRRMHLMRKRAALLAHIHNTTSQYNRSDIGKKLADKANRDGVAERFPGPAVQQSMEVDLARINHYDCLLGDIELSILTTAKQHHAQTLYLRRTVPGIGEILSRVLLYEIHDIGRCPRVQDFLSYGRLVKCTKESAGKRYGTSGTKIGNTSLKGAFSEAAVVCLRNNPAGQKDLTKLETKHGKGKALTMLAHKRGRAVYDMLQRHTAFDVRRLLSGSWNGADAPNASLDDHGLSLSCVLGQACIAASLNAQEPIGPFAQILWPLIGHPLRLQ
jgi:transposase